ncbi:MAG: aminodeoxychorismate/anthranilate synthase component II [Candidatus Melainabacteria bacterium]|nr:aminodeoxychorismate/anthranilate synthase component II [Candidatus Melainabacteria bacterium]
MTILVIDNYDSFSFNLVQSLREVSTHSVVVKRNDEITLEEVLALQPHGIVISPGPGHPANERDFGINLDLIKNQAAIGCPILGICLGHQGIVHTFGGSIIQANQIMHGKTSVVRVLQDSPLFSNCPKEFVAMRYHSLVAIDETLPTCLTVTARDTASNMIMAIEHNSAPIFGLQFHPESIGTPEGKLILKNFVELTEKQTRVESNAVDSKSSAQLCAK